MHMRSIFILTLLTILVSCETQIKFESRKWRELQDFNNYPSRELMLRDIVDNRKFIGFSFDQIIDSLGQPTALENAQLFYSIKTEYGSDIDPVYTKDLVLTIDQDSIVTYINVKEWRK
ncbi:MAG: hypothetical protein EBR30_11510 [Cytophagia bacterium]|nr:hypothetical protein [Cytophagia bacterium]